MELARFVPAEDKKKTLINLQWLVVLATSYLLLFKKAEVVQDPWAFGLIVALLISVLVLYRLPEPAFDHRLFSPVLAIFDTILITAAILTNREGPWDLYLVFFFCLFITATGENLIKIVAACLLVAILSASINPFSSANPFQFDPDLLFRIPFLFGVSILYAYLAEQARNERSRAERAEHTEHIKRQLVSALAHDIKNPLGVMMGYAEAVQAGLQDSASKDKLEMLDRIQDNGQRIVKLVTGFLEASKTEAGAISFEPKPVDINTILREASQQQMSLLRQKEINLKVDLNSGLPRVLGDEMQLDRVFWNLVGNAIKFTPRGGFVTLRSWLEKGRVCASVSDTGMGIPKHELPMLFGEFRRLKGSGKVEGTGLGLFIVKTIVEAHGGTVEAESEVNQGSTFTVRLPMAA
ncbi:MAG: HAMP domain-containing histidine kinase [Deltaproteobacteria bacterium]|nr:HAMP domain-containing histidine kinase [Deltaproteobacteria bacterium]